MELFCHNQREPVVFKIEKLVDVDNVEEIDTINPGKIGQAVKMHLPTECKEGYIIRRKRN